MATQTAQTTQTAMRVIVFLNAAAGTSPTDPDPVAVAQAFRDAGVEADIRPTPGPDLPQAVRDAAAGVLGPADAVVAAGGDGTVSAAAGALAGTGIPLGVLPVGTLNHFAKDLGLPLTLPEAVRVIAAAAARAVDVGEVNGRVFVNNASIGLYPHIVSRRDKQRERLGRNKWVAMLVAAIAVFRRYPVVEVVLNTPVIALRRRTPLVFIGNNAYRTEGLNLGGRARLDGGELCAYFTNRTGRFGLLRLALRALLGRLNQAKDFDALCSPDLWVETRKKTLRIALDGEVTRLKPPLHFRSRAGALRVLAPPPP